jgi:hypothetical protein
MPKLIEGYLSIENPSQEDMKNLIDSLKKEVAENND